ncbi:MAG: LysM domain-containing protein, partial [Fibrobacterota bacterium]
MISSRLKIRFLLALAVAGSATAGVNLEDYTVRRGQTVSYIAFLKYGQYNDSIVKVLKTDNPKIENLDLIQVGSVLKIRKDVQAPAAMEKDPAKRIQMASKKAVVTMVVGTGEIRRANGVVEKLLPNRFLSTGDAIGRRRHHPRRRASGLDHRPRRVVTTDPLNVQNERSEAFWRRTLNMSMSATPFA